MALAIFVAWGLPAALATHGGFVSQGLGHHLLGRTATPYEGHSGWPGYYLVATLAAFFPWGSFLPAALANAWRQRRDSGTAFLLAWVLGPLVLVELTTSKLPHYMLVTFPALAVLVAMLVESRITGARDWTRAERFLEAGIFAVACTGSAVAGGYVAARFDTGGLHVAATTLLATSLAVGVIGTIAWFSGRPRNPTALVAGCATTLYLVVFAVLVPALEPSRLAPRLGQAVARDLGPGDRLVLCKVGEDSVGFYLPRTPDLMGDPDAIVAQLRTTPANALVLVPDDARQLAARLQAGDAGRWVSLDVVDGTILPSLAMRRIQVLRREATATGGRD
jgi:4-amino-4-deoxy-L-arabinose transferase-like glycosyltransferase